MLYFLLLSLDVYYAVLPLDNELSYLSIFLAALGTSPQYVS